MANVRPSPTYDGTESTGTTDGRPTLNFSLHNMITTTFGDYQADERYRKLERTLKLSLMKRMEANKNNMRAGLVTPTLSSVSSINGDTFDLSSVSPFLNSSRIGSEVVSSSTNLRKRLLQKKNLIDNHKTTATSSVKGSVIKEDDDFKAMPPPSSVKVISYNSKNSGPLHRPTVGANDHAMTSEGAASSACDFDSRMTRACVNFSDKDLNKYKSNLDGNACQNVQDPHLKLERLFSKWRVMLNDQGQLIIKGTLEGGKVSRSKPVIRRLSASSVQSVYKHIYHLQGNIVDERNELPDYVRGKFFNGFPDDWENVYEIWRHFVASGSKPNFRWPTRVTDSDDDLRSDITELTCTSIRKTIVTNQKIPAPIQKQRQNISNPRHSYNEKQELSIAESHCSCCSNNNLKPAEDKNSLRSSNKDTEEKTSKVLASNYDKNLETHHTSIDKENQNTGPSNDSNSSPLPSSSIKLTDIIYQDKLSIIIENLADKNCSREYIDKLFQMLDCMNYVVSYKSMPEQKNASNKEPSHRSDQNFACYTEDSGAGKENNSRLNSSCVEFNAISRSPHREGIGDSEALESETYAGVLRIPSEKILRESRRPRERLPRVRNSDNVRKVVKNETPREKSVSGEKPILQGKSYYSLSKDRESKRAPSRESTSSLTESEADYDRESLDSRRSHPAKYPSQVEKCVPVVHKSVSEAAIPPVSVKENKVVEVCSVPDRFASNVHRTSPEEKKVESKTTRLGAMDNPYKLTSWSPRVVHGDTSSLGLIFEGKLLNEAGHVTLRKFSTDLVLRRLSSRLVETVNHDFYELVGDLNDVKQVVPRKLLKQCSRGCPGKINHFCKAWEAAKEELLEGSGKENTTVHLHNNSTTTLSISTSSKGRRIMPPLSYWTGERISVKDNQSVYSPGNSQGSSIASMLESPKSNQDQANSERKRQVKSPNEKRNNHFTEPRRRKSQDVSGNSSRTKGNSVTNLDVRI
ncbi:uncharacterized protein LOC105694348 [Orussus abietinus]|uniref:uncharacterized protein LOC105694348 n=1 Tax=Orussus abietinus TaxID=222816 RepID=UPI000C715A82|nr:uncharacterized protein LOC105694348 [Orussus abietinus]